MSRPAKTAVAAIALSVLLSAVALATPRGEREHGPFQPGPRFDRLVEELNLTSEQVEEIGALRDEGRKATISVRKDLRRLRHKLEGEMMEDLPDIDRVRDLARKIGEAETDLRIKRLEGRIALLKVLTEEQRDMLPGPFPIAGGPDFDRREGDRPGPGRHGKRGFGERFCPGGLEWRGTER